MRSVNLVMHRNISDDIRSIYIMTEIISGTTGYLLNISTAFERKILNIENF